MTRSALTLLTLALATACGGSDRSSVRADRGGTDTAARPSDDVPLEDRLASSLSGAEAAEVCTVLQYTRHEALTSRGLHDVRCIYQAFQQTAEECFDNEAYCLYECGFRYRTCRYNDAPRTPREDSHACAGLRPEAYAGCDATIGEVTSCFAELILAHSVLTGVVDCEAAAEITQPPVSAECEAILGNPDCTTLMVGG